MNANHDDETAMPAWAQSLGRQGYRAFVSLIENYFDRRHIQIEMDLDRGTVRPDLNAEIRSGEFGLQNIAQLCRQSDRDQWRDLIKAHFDSIFEVHGDDNALEVDLADFSRVRPRLRARLYPADIAENADELAQRPGPEGTLEVLVLDMPTAIRTVSRAEMEHWGLDLDDLFEIGRDNLVDAGRLSSHAVALEQGTQLKLLSGDGYYAASHALIIDEYYPDPPPHGLLVGIPKRDVLIVHEIQNVGVIEAATAMLQVLASMHRDGPGSLSPYLYWYRDGEYAVLPYESDDDSLTLIPPDDFMDVLDELSALAEMS